MKIPLYWAKGRYEGKNAQGKAFEFEAWGSSSRSPEEAKQEGDRRARRAFEIVALAGQKPDDYDYRDRSIREEILDRVIEEGAEIALITRNRYGARVLNCAKVLFADVDVEPVQLVGLVANLLEMFGAGKGKAARHREAVQAAIGRVQAWAGRNAAHGFRLYRTHGGLRLLFTDKLYEPNTPETTRILEELQSDPLYIRLTQKQECFRARLTAKPWRCGCSRPPAAAYPWRDAAAERVFHEWVRKYEAHGAGFRTCEFVGHFGAVGCMPAITKIVELHDRETRIASDAPLA